MNSAVSSRDRDSRTNSIAERPRLRRTRGWLYPWRAAGMRTTSGAGGATASIAAAQRLCCRNPSALGSRRGKEATRSPPAPRWLDACHAIFFLERSVCCFTQEGTIWKTRSANVGIGVGRRSFLLTKLSGSTETIASAAIAVAAHCSTKAEPAFLA